MKTKVEFRKVGDVMVVRFYGNLTVGTGDLMLRDAVNGLLREGSKKIVVSCGDVQTFDNSGMGELVGCYTLCQRERVELLLAAVPPRMSDILTVTQLITIFNIYETEDAAVEALAA